MAVSDQVLQRLEDAKQKTRGQCSILKELASYSTTAFGLRYTDLNMSATSRQLDIYDQQYRSDMQNLDSRLAFTHIHTKIVWEGFNTARPRRRKGEMVGAFPTSNPYFT